MTVSEWLQQEINVKRKWLRPRATCADGFTVSIQASEYHYSKPSLNDAESYTHVELGYPSAAEDALMSYAESSDRPTGTVYGYVPIEVAEQVVAAHGGIV